MHDLLSSQRLQGKIRNRMNVRSCPHVKYQNEVVVSRKITQEFNIGVCHQATYSFLLTLFGGFV